MATCSLILVDNMLLCSVKLPIEINVRNFKTTRLNCQYASRQWSMPWLYSMDVNGDDLIKTHII